MKKWIQAARLRTLPLSLAGIVLAGLLAKADGYFNWLIFILSILTASLFQILSNFANDYGDAEKGTDNEQRIGPERAIQSGLITKRQMKKAIYITALFSFVSALILVLYSFGLKHWLSILAYLILGIASIVAAIKYTVGKSAYGYYGMGDFFVLIFFGFVSIMGGYFLYAKALDWTLIFPAVSIGFLSMGVLNLNNMRDIENDRTSDKNTIPVKIGIDNAKKYHILLMILPLFLVQAYNIHHLRSYWQWLFILPYILILKHTVRVINIHNPKDFDPELKKLAIATFLFALFFGLGQVLH